MISAKDILEFDAGFMRNAFGLVDSQLEIVDKYMTEDFKRDGDSPLVDESEYLHGIGFVMAQRYLTSSCGVLRVEKKRAFFIGPKTAGGVPYAAVVNAVANHWKHSDEWDFNKLTDLAKGTIQTIETLGVEVPQQGGYVAANVFAKIGLKKFEDLTAILTQWSDAVESSVS